MHHGDVECLLQTILDIEALRRLDVLQVDTAEGGGDTLHSFAELLRILFSHFNVKHIDTAVNLEEQTFTLHHGLAAHGADVTKSEHSCSVRDHCHQITFVGVLVSIVGILLNLQTGISHARRVGETQVGLCTISLRRLYFDFSRPSTLMIFECGLFRDFYHCVLLYWCNKSPPTIAGILGYKFTDVAREAGH